MPSAQTQSLAEMSSHLFGQGAGCIRRLLPREDVEVVISGMPARMTFSADGRPEDDEVFRYAGMNESHSAHGAAGIIEDLQMQDDKRKVLDAAA